MSEIKNSGSSCPIYCFNGGVCSFVDLNTGKSIKSCNTSSSLVSCSAKCDCKDKWHGYDCQINDDQLSKFVEMQTNILTLISHISESVKTPEMVLSIVDSFSSVMGSADRQPLPVSSIQLSDSIIKSALSSAMMSPNITVGKVTKFTDIVNTIISSALKSSPSSSSSIQDAASQLYENFVDGIGLLALRDSKTFHSNGTNVFVSAAPAKGLHVLPSLGII